MLRSGGGASLPHRELWERMRSVEGMTTAAARFYETDLLLESGGKLRCFIDFLFFFICWIQST